MSIEQHLRFFAAVFYTVLFWAFVAWSVIQSGYVLYFFLRFFRLRAEQPQIQNKMTGKVSIIICARNEAKNLSANLPVVLSQKYHEGAHPMYEVIVVDDGSTDETPEVLAALTAQYPALVTLNIPAATTRTLQGKKFALSQGIAIAKNDRLLLTDADCMPASNEWLSLMVAPLAAGKEIVAGYGAYYPAPGLLNVFIRWETVHTFLQLSTYAIAGVPYMAVGRNIGCTKKILLEAQRSQKWNLLPSGDDDMLVNISGTATNIAIAAAPATFTYSHAEANMKDYIAQKQRHMSTGKYYRPMPQVLLGIYGVTHASLWLYFFILLASPFCVAALAIMGLRCTLTWCVWAMVAGKLKERKISWLLPLLDVAQMVYNFAFLPYILIKNKRKWK